MKLTCNNFCICIQNSIEFKGQILKTELEILFISYLFHSSNFRQLFIV